MYTAIHVEVAAYRQHVGAQGIARPHLKGILTLFNKVGYLYAESRVSALVRARGTAVYIYVGHRIDPFEIKEKTSALHLWSNI